MADTYTHEGKKSWWDGSYTSLCGQRWPAGTAEVPFFATTTCPACKKAKKK